MPVIPAGANLAGLIAKNLAAQAALENPNAMNSAIGIAAALKAADAALDVTNGATNLADIDSDAIRVNNLIVANVAGLASGFTLAQIIKRISDAVDAAMQLGTNPQLVADVKARKRQVAQNAARSVSAKLIADISSAAPGPDSNALAVAREAAKKIVADTTVGLAQSGAKPADLAAQAKAVAESVASAIKEDLIATTKVFATPSAIGNANIAAALVAKAQDKASAVTAASAAFDAGAAGSAALKVSAAVATFTLPAASSPADRAAQAAAIAAIAFKADDGKTLNVANMQTLVASLQTALQALIGSSTAADGSTAALAQQAAVAMLSVSAGTKVDFMVPLGVGSAPSALPTTTSTSSTSSTSRLTTTTLCDSFGPPPLPGQLTPPTTCATTTTIAATTSTTAISTLPWEAASNSRLQPSSGWVRW